MELIFQDQRIQLDNASSAEDIIKKMNQLLDKGYYFSHFTADDKTIFEEHEEFLKQHEGHITVLEVYAKTVKEFVNELLLETEIYVEGALPELGGLAEEFYDNPTAESWTKMDQLLGGLQWIDQMLMTIGKTEAVPSNWEGYLNVSTAMREEIQNLAEALKNEDHVLVGDIIQYELKPNFEALDDQVKETIDNEGTRYDLN
ncbi:hypothetical protein CSV71_14295 [Sporosarcina sp. P21c]|uniref:hypothetical protein n=1 Tax=Sporosarcina sp. P21c TaxID=2048255 RepID=UPI000C16C808|nr:hypothetical protein [Sporosarcina sp. P21c]PIC88555.1 hypothetical protein CSV71_14295 [Sporosarcina sp. P21c]